MIEAIRFPFQLVSYSLCTCMAVLYLMLLYRTLSGPGCPTYRTYCGLLSWATFYVSVAMYFFLKLIK